MTQTRFTRDFPDRHLVENCRGLILAAALKPESLQLLLGGTSEEVMRYQDEARGRLGELKRRIAAARAI